MRWDVRRPCDAHVVRRRRRRIELTRSGGGFRSFWFYVGLRSDLGVVDLTDFTLSFCSPYTNSILVTNNLFVREQRS